MKITPYKSIYLKEKVNINEFIGYLKGKYNTIKQVLNCPKFKTLTQGDKQYILDELKSEGWR